MARFKPHYLALSYIDEEINAELLNWMPKNWRPKIVVKIENQAGIDNCVKICQNNAYYALMLDRGELGVNLPFERLGVLQRGHRAGQKARQAGHGLHPDTGKHH